MNHGWGREEKKNQTDKGKQPGDGTRDRSGTDSHIDNRQTNNKTGDKQAHCQAKKTAADVRGRRKSAKRIDVRGRGER